MPRISISGQSSGGSIVMNHLFAYSASIDEAMVAAGTVNRGGHVLLACSRWIADDHAIIAAERAEVDSR